MTTSTPTLDASAAAASAPAPTIAMPTPKATLSARLGKIVRDGWPVLLVAVLALLVWYVLTETVYKGKGFLVPSPQEVGAAVLENVSVLALATLATLREATLGFVTAIVLGIALAALLSQSRLLERSIY